MLGTYFANQKNHYLFQRLLEVLKMAPPIYLSMYIQKINLKIFKLYVSIGALLSIFHS